MRVKAWAWPYLSAIGRELGDRGAATRPRLLQVLGHARGGLLLGVELGRLLLAQVQLVGQCVHG